MTLEEAIKLAKEKTNGKYKPETGNESDKVFVFTMVTANGQHGFIPGNNSIFVVTKDSKIVDWRPVGRPLPDEYLLEPGQHSTEIDASTIRKAVRKVYPQQYT